MCPRCATRTTWSTGGGEWAGWSAAGNNGTPYDFRSKLLPPDWERFTPLMENSIHRVPAVEKAEIIQLLNGPEGFTPDGEFLLGPTDVGGFWVAGGFCGHGRA